MCARNVFPFQPQTALRTGSEDLECSISSAVITHVNTCKYNCRCVSPSLEPHLENREMCAIASHPYSLSFQHHLRTEMGFPEP